MLLRSQKLVQEGNFDDALKENEKVMLLSLKESPGDQAVYNMGLIYSHHKNPGKDFTKALTYFQKVTMEFPQSPLAWQAAIWIDVLKKMNARETKIAEEEYSQRANKMLSSGDYQGALKENRKVLSLYSTAPPADQALFNIGLIYAHYGNTEKDYREAVRNFEKLVQKYPESPLGEQAKIWISVLNIIEKTKQVDIEIDKKKKELTQ